MSYNLIGLEYAVKTLNKNKHNGENTYNIEEFDNTYIVKDEFNQYRLTMFEAIAISNEYKKR